MRLLLVAALLAGIAEARPAQADCGMPTWAGAWTDSPIPAQGSLYVYIGNGRGYSPDPTVAWHGVGNAEVVRLSETVVRVDYSGADGADMVVAVPYNADAWTYHLDARWTAPATPPRVLQYWRHAHGWTCSYSDSLM